MKKWLRSKWDREFNFSIYSVSFSLSLITSFVSSISFKISVYGSDSHSISFCLSPFQIFYFVTFLFLVSSIQCIIWFNWQLRISTSATCLWWYYIGVYIYIINSIKIIPFSIHHCCCCCCIWLLLVRELARIFHGNENRKIADNNTIRQHNNHHHHRRHCQQYQFNEPTQKFNKFQMKSEELVRKKTHRSLISNGYFSLLILLIGF